jgi:glucosamine--fructose-6-phosphate aminotransferase (isomerizing)
VIATLATGLALVRTWAGRPAALDGLPDRLAAAPDWPQLAETLATTPHIFTVGRGPALGIAKEAALKLAETCGIAGLAYSAAELAHGPMALAGQGFPILAFLQDDAARPLSAALLATLAARPTPVFAAGTDIPGAVTLPTLPTADPDADLLPMLVSAYRAIEQAARARGLDPDHPRSLQKVTQTI